MALIIVSRVLPFAIVNQPLVEVLVLLHCFWLLPADIVTVVAYALDWFALSIECGNKDTIQWQGR